MSITLGRTIPFVEIKYMMECKRLELYILKDQLLALSSMKHCEDYPFSNLIVKLKAELPALEEWISEHEKHIERWDKVGYGYKEKDN